MKMTKSLGDGRRMANTVPPLLTKYSSWALLKLFRQQRYGQRRQSQDASFLLGWQYMKRHKRLTT